MSADNWAICPQCKLRGDHKKIHVLVSSKEAYGKVTPEEYENIKQLEMEAAEEEPQETLREDYECYINEDGEFIVDYKCSCDECGFVFRFKHEETAKTSVGKKK